MKKYWKITLLLLSVICLLALMPSIATDSEQPYTIDTPYEYPVVPGTQEWIDLGDVIARRKACQIPDEILQEMTTEALCQTVLDYPFLSEIYAFNTFEIGYETVKRRFNGLQELENRPDYYDALSRYCLEAYSLDNKTLGTYVANDLYSFYTGADNAESNTSQYALPHMTTVITPAQSEVEAAAGRVYGVKFPEIDSSVYEMDKMQQIIADQKVAFPSATLLRGATFNNLPSYNCISYALYNQSANNNIWIGLANSNGTGPWTYFTDGSYKRTFLWDNGIQPGDLLVWGDNAENEKYGPYHIGIIQTTKLGLMPDKIISKWGAGGLWEHTFTDCPYYEEVGDHGPIYRKAILD